ncbi:hypothetical protein L9F63_019226, partial [Diploptera punctata]
RRKGRYMPLDKLQNTLALNHTNDHPNHSMNTIKNTFCITRKRYEYTEFAMFRDPIGGKKSHGMLVSMGLAPIQLHEDF